MPNYEIRPTRIWNFIESALSAVQKPQNVSARKREKKAIGFYKKHQKSTD
jgi:hypothetical protein